MLNILRMDLYRLIRSKSVYVCFAFLVLMGFLCYWLVWLMGTPEGQAAAERIGITAVVYINGETESLDIEQYDSLDMFREIGMDGGAYSCILGILMALFVCMDFHSGFVKNTLSLHRHRWKYIAGKTMLAGLLSLCFLVLSYGASLLINLFFHNMLPPAGLRDILYYLTWAWLNTTAFLALIIMVCVFTRSTSASILATVLLGSGLVVTLLSFVTGLFNADGWTAYTLYINLTYGPSHYTGLGDLKTYAVSIVFLAVYSVAAAAALSKRDI